MKDLRRIEDTFCSGGEEVKLFAIKLKSSRVECFDSGSSRFNFHETEQGRKRREGREEGRVKYE